MEGQQAPLEDSSPQPAAKDEDEDEEDVAEEERKDADVETEEKKETQAVQERKEDEETQAEQQQQQQQREQEEEEAGAAMGVRGVEEYTSLLLSSVTDEQLRSREPLDLSAQYLEMERAHFAHAGPLPPVPHTRVGTTAAVGCYAFSRRVLGGTNAATNTGRTMLRMSVLRVVYGGIRGGGARVPQMPLRFRQ
eukprot:1355851-Rhodomonas_salina.1